LTLAQAVHRAVETCELGEPDDALDELLLRFEDADEPIHAIEDPALRIDEALGAIDVDWEQSGSLSMARSVVLYLAYRRDEIDAAPEELLRLAARAEYAGHPPEHVAAWLEGAGVSV
jgi:hypothetical protein